MDLIFTLIVITGTGFVMYRRYREDPEGNQGYLFVLGTLFALSLGVLLTGLYVRDPVQWILPVLFFLIVLTPRLLIYLRDHAFRGGDFQRAALTQGVIRWMVWSRSERMIESIAKACQLLRKGEVDRSRDVLRRLEEKGPDIDRVTEKRSQLHILISGRERNWVSVVREFGRIEDLDDRQLWTPTIIYVAQGAVEREKFTLAERMLIVLEGRSLTDQQEVAAQTARLGYLMLQGQYDAGKMLIRRMKDKHGDALPAAYESYWKARGCQANQKFDEARRLYDRALEKLDGDVHPEWRQVIEERKTELEIEETRHQQASRYRYQGDQLEQPAYPAGEITSEPVPEAEPVRGETPGSDSTPPVEVMQFIHRVNRLPWASTVLLVLIGLIFLSVRFGVQTQYPDGSQISNPTHDPVALAIFGMKADYMIDEPYESGSVNLRERLRKVSGAVSGKPFQVESLEELKKALDRQFKADPDSTGLTEENLEKAVRNVWIESRFAELFGFTEQGNINFPKHQYWRLATCTLLHIGWIHLLLNGYALWILGKLLENIYGIADFLVIYLFSGLTGSLASWKFGVSPASAGASGAIFGLLGAAIALTIIKKKGIPEQIRKRLAGPLLFWTVVNLALGFWIAGIDNAGHIGGLVGGLLIGLLLPVDLNSEQHGGGIFRFFKWTGLLVLVGLYGWSLFKGIEFALAYVNQIP